MILSGKVESSDSRIPKSYGIILKEKVSPGAYSGYKSYARVLGISRSNGHDHEPVQR